MVVLSCVIVWGVFYVLEIVWWRMLWLFEILYFFCWFLFELIVVILLFLFLVEISIEVDCFLVLLFIFWVVRGLFFVMFGRNGMGCWFELVLLLDIFVNGFVVFFLLRDIFVIFCVLNLFLKEICFLESFGCVCNFLFLLCLLMLKVLLNILFWWYFKFLVYLLLLGIILELW